MICFITDKKQKEKIAESVLLDLPEWFGLPESTREYIEKSPNMPFWAAMEGENPRGFIVLKETSPHTAEIYVMGVKKSPITEEDLENSFLRHFMLMPKKRNTHFYR